MDKAWIKHKRKSSSGNKYRSASLPRLNQNKQLTNQQQCNVSDSNPDNGTMLRIFNLRQPTNLTGRFPATVAVHAKVEEINAKNLQIQDLLEQQDNHSSNKKTCEKVPNLVQPLSLLPDWR